MKPHNLGLVLGAFAGIAHLLWSVLVYLGLAEAFVVFVEHLHFVESPFRILDISLSGAVILVIAASLVGYVIGFVLGKLAGLLAKY
ncbi:MAG: hypothetical protein AAB597_00970 [Patescibacteria group bacterium]